MNAPMVNSDTHLNSASPMLGQLRLRVFTDMEAVKSIWVPLEATGVSTVYQSYVWCRTWIQRVGKERDISPVIIVGETIFGEAMFILPLHRRRKYGIRIIEAMTAPQGAYGFGIFNQAFLSTDARIWFHAYFNNIVAALPMHDVLRLADIPEEVKGHQNPLLMAPHFQATNRSHIMKLQSDYVALLELKRSPDSRRSIRKRDNKLQNSGLLIFDLPDTLEERKLTVEKMLVQQKARLAEAGIHSVFDDIEQQFITDLVHTRTSEGPFLRPYRLMLDGEIIAVMLGAYRHGTYWALISSLAPGEVRKHSPGDFALRSMIKSLCEDGTKTLDFSAGDTAYKGHWSDQQISLYVIITAKTWRGLMMAILMLLREKIKRFAKQTPVLNAVLFALRRYFKGQKAPA